jgi:hypothetical protein
VTIPPPISPNCQLHFGPSPDGRYGSLVDPNGHRWHICSECINSLWQDKQALNQTIDMADNAMNAMLNLAKEIGCECSVCLALKIGAEIGGYDVASD